MANEVTVDAPATQYPPVDPNVKLPPSVVAAAEKANSFFRPPEPPPAEPPPAEPPPAEPPPVDTSTVTESSPADPNWEHQYKSMKGRWEGQRVQIEQLQTQLSEMGNEVMQLNRALQTKNQPPPEPPRPDIDPNDVSTYGQELMEAIGRTAANIAHKAVQQTVQPELAKLSRQTVNVQRQLNQNVQKDLVQALTEAVPNWDQINTSPEFKTWLNLPDIYSGRKRSDLAEEARLRGDNRRVVAFFRGYLAEHPPQAAPPAAQPRNAAMTLENLAAPGRGRPASSDAAGLPAEQQIITRDFIKQFYAKVRANAFLGREAEKDRIEREIFAAQNSNRVR